MGRVLTSSVAMSYIVEASQGNIGAGPWRKLEPNSIANFGGEFERVVRNPIGAGRRRQKGTITNRTAGVEFETDVTYDSFRDFVEAFVFARATNAALSNLNAATVASGFTVPARATAYKINHLFYGQGYGNAQFDGLKPLTAALAVAGVIAVIGAGLTVGAAPPNARVSFAGFQAPGVIPGGWVWNAMTDRATLTLAGIGTGLNLSPGQFVHIGLP